MTFLKITRLLAALLVLLSVTAAFADDYSAFDVTVKTTGIQRESPPLRVFVTVDKVKLTFLTPDSFRVRDDVLQKRVLMEGITKNCTIVFRRSAALEDGTTYRDVLLARYPDAKIVGESSKNLADHSSPVFDLQWSREGINYSARIVFIHSNAGPLEIDASGTSDVKSPLNSILATFTVSDDDGNLVIPQGSDQT